MEACTAYGRHAEQTAQVSDHSMSPQEASSLVESDYPRGQQTAGRSKSSARGEFTETLDDRQQPEFQKVSKFSATDNEEEKTSRCLKASDCLTAYHQIVKGFVGMLKNLSWSSHCSPVGKSKGGSPAAHVAVPV